MNLWRRAVDPLEAIQLNGWSVASLLNHNRLNPIRNYKQLTHGAGGVRVTGASSRRGRRPTRSFGGWSDLARARACTSEMEARALRPAPSQLGFGLGGSLGSRLPRNTTRVQGS